MAPENKVVDLKERRRNREKIARRMMNGNLKSGDFWLVMLTCILVIFGLIMVFSASYYTSISKDGSPYSYLIKHAVYIVMGVFVFGLMSSIDYHKYDTILKGKLPYVIVGISAVLLIWLLIPGAPLVVSYNGSARWINLKVFTLMPGEVAKIAGIIFTACILNRPKPKRPAGSLLSYVDTRYVTVCLIAGVMAGMILIKNAATGITFLIVIAGMIFVSGIKWKHIFAIAAVGFAGIGAMIAAEPYRMKRLTSFRDPFADMQGTGYQVVQSLLALGSGGLFGSGLGKSVQKTLYLPEPQNDFIMAVIGEEIGFIGLLFMFAVYMLLIWRCVHISMNAPDMLGMLLGTGISVMIAFQVIANALIVSSWFPPTGISLPFISWGGNSLLLMIGSMGIMLNISRHSAR